MATSKRFRPSIESICSHAHCVDAPCSIPCAHCPLTFCLRHLVEHQTAIDQENKRLLSSIDACRRRLESVEFQDNRQELFEQLNQWVKATQETAEAMKNDIDKRYEECLEEFHGTKDAMLNYDEDEEEETSSSKKVRKWHSLKDDPQRGSIAVGISRFRTIFTNLRIRPSASNHFSPKTFHPAGQAEIELFIVRFLMLRPTAKPRSAPLQCWRCFQFWLQSFGYDPLCYFVGPVDSVSIISFGLSIFLSDRWTPVRHELWSYSLRWSASTDVVNISQCLSARHVEAIA